jgi:hypothetical protein
MAKFVCLYCGKEFEGRPGEENRVLCSKKCYQNFMYEQTHFTCPNNEAVVCTQKVCWKCGWNPKVAQKRLEVMV